MKFTATGTVTLRNVVFTIEAANLAEARKKAEAGDFVDYETTVAETSDWQISPHNVKADHDD